MYGKLTCGSRLGKQVSELTAGWCESFYEKADMERRRSDALDREAGWPQDVAHRSPNFSAPIKALSVECSELMSTPTFHGALASLLGSDFFLPRNASLHVSSAVKEQTFHKVG